MSKKYKKVTTDRGEKLFCFSRCVECGAPFPEKVCVPSLDVWVLPKEKDPISEDDFVSYPPEAFCNLCTRALDRDFIYGV